MKKNLLSLLLVLGVLFTSCKKDSPAVTDNRDKFVGTWNGTQRIVIPDLAVDYSQNISGEDISLSSSSNQIVIDFSKTAIVNGNSYTYNQFTETTTDPTYGDIIIIFNGTGTINGSNIVEGGTCNTIIQGQTFNGTWSGNLVKQ